MGTICSAEAVTEIVWVAAPTLSGMSGTVRISPEFIWTSITFQSWNPDAETVIEYVPACTPANVK